jgi:hypothetical protein
VDTRLLVIWEEGRGKRVQGGGRRKEEGGRRRNEINPVNTRLLVLWVLGEWGMSNLLLPRLDGLMLRGMRKEEGGGRRGRSQTRGRPPPGPLGAGGVGDVGFVAAGVGYSSNR